MTGARSWFVGVDVGGTFTDVVLADSDGGVRVGKVLTTPEDPRVGVVDGVQQVLAAAGIDPSLVSRVVHGTTLATNVVLQRSGGPVALVTTEGFADLLRLGREARVEEDRFDLFFTPLAPPVDPALTFEVRERVNAAGEVLVALAPDALGAAVARVAAAAPAGIAVCFLHSYANPAHEVAVVEALRRALPGTYVVASSEVWPEMREFERAMTTVVCAMVGPVMAGYLEGLGARLAELGVTCPIEIMESSGGVMTAERAARRPVLTVESGGAAGVIAAGIVGQAAGAGDVISFDMGGTTAKTGIVRDGRPAIAHDFQVGGKGSFGGTRAGTGVPVKIPVVDLAEVGAGGGSVAWLDAAGALRVGPRSAGAAPGPACYGRGGTEPTVTDANLVLGYLDPVGLAGGVTLSSDLAVAAIETLASPLGLDVAAVARGIHEIVNANMAAAIRVVTVQRGIDPRDFTLVGFGGAGPMHVARLAETFGIRSVVVPWAAGVASAVGLVSSDLTVDLVQTRLVDLTDLSARAADAMAGLEAAYAELEAQRARRAGRRPGRRVRRDPRRRHAGARAGAPAHGRGAGPVARGADRGVPRGVPRRVRHRHRRPRATGEREGAGRARRRQADTTTRTGRRARRRGRGRGRAPRVLPRGRRLHADARLPLDAPRTGQRVRRPGRGRGPRHDDRRPTRAPRQRRPVAQRRPHPQHLTRVRPRRPRRPRRPPPPPGSEQNVRRANENVKSRDDARGLGGGQKP